MTSVDAIGVFQQSAVDEVAAVTMDDVQQAKAELELGVELEEGQVDVATHADLEIEVEGLQSQDVVLAGGEIDHGIDAADEVRAEVIVARRGKLHVDGHGDESVLEDLGGLVAAHLFVIDAMLLSEVDGGGKAKGEVGVHAEFAEHANREARAEVVYLCIPLLAGLRVDVAVVLQLHVLHVQAQEEAVVEEPLVDVRAVLHLSFLCGSKVKSKK